MEKHRIYTCIVKSDGSLLEWEDRQGKCFLSQFEQVIRYAQALQLSSQNQIHFFYFHPQLSDWFEIELERHSEEKEYVIVSAKQTVLPFELSERELEIITLVSCGLSNTDIAEQLFLSNRTVAKHIEHIFNKLGIDNRTELAVFAIQTNLYKLPLSVKLRQSKLPLFEIIRIVEESTLSVVKSRQPFSLRKSYQKPITIGVPFVEKGIGVIDTQELLNGTALAIDLINQKGGIAGRPLKMIQAGYKVEDKESILQAYNNLFDQEVDAISTNYACYLPEVHELVATEGVPYLHIATHSGTDKLPYKIDNIFQVCASDINYGLGIVRFLQSYQQQYGNLVKNRRVVIVTVKWQPIDIGVDILVASLQKLNWSVEILTLSESGEISSGLMAKLHNIDPTLIVFASYFTEDIVNFYTIFSSFPLNAVIYGIYAPSTLQPHQKLCEGVVWASTTGLMENHLGQQFRQLYQQHFHHFPSYSQASVAFDQVNILANTWRQISFHREFKKVNQGIRSQIHYGVNGAYFLGNEHQIGLTYPDNTDDLSISQPHLIYQIQQGKNTVIAPALFAESHFQLPYWFDFYS